MDPISGMKQLFTAALYTSAVLLLCAACSDGNGNNIVPRDLHTTRCISNVSAADRHVFECDGVQFKVLLTQGCIDAACGLIFDVHGWLSNPDEQSAGRILPLPPCSAADTSWCSQAS